MSEFLEAVGENSFLQYAVLTALLAGVASGVVGTYVVVRRITYIAGGIAHCVLGGMGAARYLSFKAASPDFEQRYGEAVTGVLRSVEPLHGALVAAIAAAVIIGLVSLRARQREDTVIGALWAIGMAVGLMFIWKTPGYNDNLMSYLFGDILMVSPDRVALIGVLDAVVLVVVVLFYKQFLAVCFDDEFARLQGVNVEFFYLLLLCLTALTVVLLVTVVGIVMTIALLTLPAAIAGNFTRTLWQNMILAAVLAIVFATGGLAVSYTHDLPPGATIILLAGAVYLLVAVGKALLKRRAA